jgi:3-oxoacyl-[acyl-carrier protein] reductase
VGDLNGKTALVTGASRGIGRPVAERLASAGAYVAVHYGHNETAANETMAAITSAGADGCLVRAELGVHRDIETLLEGLQQGLGKRPLDILVNNAGMLQAPALGDITAEDVDLGFAVNVRAPLLLVQRLLPHLANGGRIVNLSSAVTRIASPFLHYAMAKGAIEVMTRTLAQALGHREITVNAVAPGVVETDMGSWVHASPQLEQAVTATVALRRLGQPADIADVITFLASDEARWITGQTIDASGGQWLGPAAPQ